MKIRTLKMSLLALGFMVLSVTAIGCRASADIDPHGFNQHQTENAKIYLA